MPNNSATMHLIIPSLDNQQMNSIGQYFRSHNKLSENVVKYIDRSVSKYFKNESWSIKRHM